MKTLKITPGKATLFIGNRVLEIQGEDGKPIVGWMGFDASDRGTRQNRANATLFCEAFNVANETGLTPRQLLEQRNELLREIESVIVTMEGWSGGLHRPALDQLNRIIEIHKP